MYLGSLVGPQKAHAGRPRRELPDMGGWKLVQAKGGSVSARSTEGPVSLSIPGPGPVQMAA